MEALVALTVSAILITLVGSTFLVQNTFYANILQRSRVQDNARSVAEIVSADLRSLTQGGLVVADSARLVIRVPLTLVAVCRTSANHAVVHFPGGLSLLDNSDVSGVGVRATTGAWSFYAATWSTLYDPKSDDAQQCATNGADTTKATAEFVRLRLNGVTPSIPPVGSALLLYRSTEYAIQASALDPGATALYRGPYGGTLVELATGMASDARFAYRKASGGWATQVSSGLDAVKRVRVYARARGPAEAASQIDLEFDLETDVPLRNVP